MSFESAQQGQSKSFSRRAEELDNFLTQLPDLSSGVETVQDPTLSQTIHRGSQDKPTQVRFGRIQMVLPHAHWYRVILDGNGGELPCTRLMSHGGGLIGAKDASVLAPNTRVYVIVPKDGHYGFILGPCPDLNEDGNHSFPDWICQGSGVGMLRSRYYTEYIRLLGDEGGSLNHSNHRPVDSLAGDWTQITDTGLAFHLDSEMAYMRADEETGVFVFQDGYARLAGRNLDIRSSVRSEEDTNDEGELTYYRGIAVYPWEALGAYKNDVDVSREVSDVNVLHKEPYAKLEPKNDDIQPFERLQTHEAYLGQGRLTTLTLPPEGALNTENVRRYSGQDKDLGVFREQISLDGTYALESAKGVTIAKRSLIPVPRRKKLAADYGEQSDSADNENYKFSGQYGSGDVHKVGDLTTEEENKQLFSAAAILDYIAYTFNWKGTHPFHYHEKDFELPEETDLKLQSNQYMPPFAELASKMWLSSPPSKTMKVDHRYEDVKYYEVMSHLSLTDDGGVVLQGGNGEEIRFCGGSIMLSAPGKVLIQSGGSTVVLAGDDFIARAYNSADITATKKDVRIKAEVNGMFMSGNSGEGAMLIENRANDVKHVYPGEGGESVRGSGVILKTKATQVATLTKDVYIRSGATGGGGSLIIDGNKGQDDIRIIGQNVYHFVTDKIRDGFGIPNVNAVNVYRSGENLFSSTVKVAGQLVVEGGGVFSSSVVSVDGHFSSAPGGRVGRLLNRGAFQQLINRIHQRLNEQRQAHQQDYSDGIEQKYYYTGKIGEQSTIDKISFGMRTEKQYGTTDFKLPQNHWQVLNNIVKVGTTWDEQDIEYQKGTQQQPWPGKQAWSVEENMLTLPKDEFKLYDLEKGTAKDRGEDYEKRELGKFVKAKASSAYYIIPNED